MQSSSSRERRLSLIQDCRTGENKKKHDADVGALRARGEAALRRSIFDMLQHLKRGCTRSSWTVGISVLVRKEMKTKAVGTFMAVSK